MKIYNPEGTHYNFPVGGFYRNLRSGFSFFLLNLATPVAFFFTFHFWGPKPAIGLAIGVSLLQAVFHWILKIRLSPFYIVASGFTVGFGMIDLFLTTPRFFRLEPFAQNALMGSVFLVTVFTRLPIAAWFVAALPAIVRPELDGDLYPYLRRVTLVWAVYLWLKALFFLYLAYRVNLGDLILLRSVIGGGTLGLMFAGEILYRNYFLRPVNGRRLGWSRRPARPPR